MASILSDLKAGISLQDIRTQFYKTYKIWVQLDDLDDNLNDGCDICKHNSEGFCRTCLIKVRNVRGMRDNIIFPQLNELWHLLQENKKQNSVHFDHVTYRDDGVKGVLNDAVIIPAIVLNPTNTPAVDANVLRYKVGNTSIASQDVYDLLSLTHTNTNTNTAKKRKVSQ